MHRFVIMNSGIQGEQEVAGALDGLYHVPLSAFMDAYIRHYQRPLIPFLKIFGYPIVDEILAGAKILHAVALRNAGRNPRRSFFLGPAPAATALSRLRTMLPIDPPKNVDVAFSHPWSRFLADQFFGFVQVSLNIKNIRKAHENKNQRMEALKDLMPRWRG